MRNFVASGATEYFLTAEVERPHRNLLLGFLRLRLGNALNRSVIDELRGETAMIRELHVYGSVKKVGQQNKSGAQHFGIGKNLLNIAEQISFQHGKTKIAVISGIGVRDYYNKRGYILQGTYMIKVLESQPYMTRVLFTVLFTIVLKYIFSQLIK